ncbi:hypothetical protein ICA15_22630 [Pseudomonas sp. P116]|nr:hypothetical protein [Pseudomonas sp. P9(2020)]MBZ9564958.1 hypothetical protein [Pseudomonas sp. P116]
MTVPVPPLLFPEILNSSGQWIALGKTHNLNDNDFRWLANVELATQALRSKQTPPMLAQSISLDIGEPSPVALAGSFILSETPDDKGAILYTPYDGLKKYDSLPNLIDALEMRFKSIKEDDSILAFLALSQRRKIVGQSSHTLSYEAIEGDIFDSQKAAILACRQIDAEAVLKELKQLPSLTSLLEKILDGLLAYRFPHLKQAQTRVTFYTDAEVIDGVPPPLSGRHLHDSMSLSDAVLLIYRQRAWPSGQLREFSHPGHATVEGDQAAWEDAVNQASGKLQVLLFSEMENYWNAPASAESARRTFFAEVLREQARAELMIKRESNILDPTQFAILHHVIQQGTAPLPTIETVRLWEDEPNYVELAGSLMISHADACLYTPTMGLQVLKDYRDLKETLISKFRAAGHQDELFGLLNLEERKRYIGFDRPHVTGERISGEIFKVLFEAIITKQRQNIAYALQAFRLSDGAVGIHSLFDKALDIHTMIHEKLLEMDAGERWVTRPVLAGVQQPSAVLEQKAKVVEKSCESIRTELAGLFESQPLDNVIEQRSHLENLKPRLTHALFFGVTSEAKLRVLSGSLKAAEQAIVETVFNAAQPNRDARRSLNGFRPDAWSIALEHPVTKDPRTLAHCVLLTERGGLDDAHAGTAILWTPALGLEVFSSINVARRALERRLKDQVDRLSLLENLLPGDQLLQQNFTLGALQLIEGNVLDHCVQSGIDHFLARCAVLRERLKGKTALVPALSSVTRQMIATNLLRTSHLAKAIALQQTLPAWLGMAPVAEQQLHLELLEQWCQSVADDKDYLSDLPSLPDHVTKRLTSLLDARFPDSKLKPTDIEITPDLALGGPACTLTEFALKFAQGTHYKVASKTATPLPAKLDQSAVQQLLLSLEIPTTYATTVVDALSDTNPLAQERKQRFYRQLPWQLLQHAHGLKLQQQLSSDAFDYLCQVLDMPDGLARETVAGAHAMVYPLSLIKTPGAVAVETLGLYLIRPGIGHKGPLVLYAPYAEQVFREFADEASVIAAINTPGNFPDLLIRRLPEAQQAVFRGVLQSSVNKTSELTLAGAAITGNLLHRFFADNLKLLPQFLNCQLQSNAQADWETAKTLFRYGVGLAAHLLPGKLSCPIFLWQAYKDFKESAEALQDHHWKKALQAFIAGAAQMLLLGSLSLEATAQTEDITVGATDKVEPETPVEVPTGTESNIPVPAWSQIRPTSPLRTELQSFEASDVVLEALKHDTSNGIYEDTTDKRTYTAIAGKVYRIEQPGAVWQMVNDENPGPSLRESGSQLFLNPDRHAVHYGKAISKLHNHISVEVNRQVMMNIEAEGMEAISLNFPQKARTIQHAIDMARNYAFQCLHNLALVKSNIPVERVDSFLKSFFGVQQIDTKLLNRIKKTIVPICNALVDPTEDLMNTERFVIGSNVNSRSTTIAFVLGNDSKKKLHLTEHFFNPGLVEYDSSTLQPFDINGHAQASTLIHEFAHQFSKAEDFASLESRRPFVDLIKIDTLKGLSMKHQQEKFQSRALSLKTPRDELFSRWNRKAGAYITWDKIRDMGAERVSKKLLKLTGCQTIEDARDAFLDPDSADIRVDVILSNADSISRLICEIGRQLDTEPVT